LQRSAWPLDPAGHARSARVLHQVHTKVLIDPPVGEAYKKKENI